MVQICQIVSYANSATLVTVLSKLLPIFCELVIKMSLIGV